MTWPCDNLCSASPCTLCLGVTVVDKDENLLGDGVNIAARLEALAQPKGISISKSIYEKVKAKSDIEFNDLGIQKIKKNEFSKI